VRSKTPPEGYSVFLSYESSIFKTAREHPRVPFSNASQGRSQETGNLNFKIYGAQYRLDCISLLYGVADIFRCTECLLQPSQPASQCAYLRSKYSPDKLFRLKESHGAVDVFDLSLNRGHLVVVIKKQDPMGNTSRWFVDDGSTYKVLYSLCSEQVS